MKLRAFRLALSLPFLLSLLPAGQVHSQEAGGSTDLDKKVQAFLDRHAGTWHDMNVPASDGKIMYDLVLKHRYKKALEIGTSTGHSAIWIAWALSKTGGKLITIEIDESRYRTAVANFKEAGLSSYIDARLADAHALVPKLEGPFDFVFCDADKGWYKNYLVAVAPKLEVGGCYTAHNVSDRSWGSYGTGEFYQYVRGLKNFETTLDRTSRAGLSVSFKKSEK